MVCGSMTSGRLKKKEPLSKKFDSSAFDSHVLLSLVLTANCRTAYFFYFLSCLAKTFLSKSVVRAAILVRMFSSSFSTMLNSPISACFVT